MSGRPGAAPLSILVATWRYPPYVAGGHELLAESAVESLRARGHRVHVLCGAGDAFSADDGVLPRLAPRLAPGFEPFADDAAMDDLERTRRTFLRASNLAAARRALARTGADALLFLNLSQVSLAPVLAARLCGVPTLGWIGDPWPLNHWLAAWRASPSAAAKPARLAFLESRWRSFRESVNLGRMLVASEALRGALVRDGLPAAEIEVLPPGLLPRMRELARAVDVRPRAAGEPLRVLCAGTLWPGKGQAVLLDALARAPRIELELAGGAAAGFERELRARAAASDLAGRVAFAGFLSQAELSRRMARAHVLAVPGLWPEPFGQATVEGMAHGLPVAGTRAGATAEIVRHGVDGLLVEPGDARALADALLALERDEGLRRRLGASARERALSDFAPERFLDGLESALHAERARGAR